MTDPDAWFTDNEDDDGAEPMNQYQRRRLKEPRGPKEHPLVELAKDMRKDLTYAQGKLTELMRQLRALGLEVPEPIVCPEPYCRWDFRTKAELEIHVYQHHDGPVPATWALAEQRAEEAA